MKKPFFNYAATAPIRPCSAKVMKEVIEENLTPLSSHRSLWLARVEKTRRQIADLIHADVDEIAFMPNTSTALSIAARSIKWSRGDRVVFLSDEFPSNRYVWENLDDVEPLLLTPCPDKTLLSQLKETDLSNVRLLTLSAISYQDGRLFSISEIARLCRERNIYFVIDGIQAVGAIPVDVRQWGCDFLACGGQKWLLGPVGSGFLYIRKQLLTSLTVPLAGWASQERVGDFGKQLHFDPSARRFEPGLLPVAEIAGLGASLTELESIGWEKIYQKIERNRKRIEAIFPQEIIKNGKEPLGGGIVTINRPLPGIESAHQGFHTRLSTHYFTQKREWKALEKAARKPEAKPSPFPYRKALITGAAQGLGRALAIELARRGCELLLVGRDHSSLKTLAEELSTRYPTSTQILLADLKNLSPLPDGQFDLLINNAADHSFSPLLQEEENRMREIFETNFFAPWKLLSHFLPKMKRGGAVLNIVTGSSRCPLPYMGSYQASKAALWTLSETLTREFPHLHITTFIPPHMPTQTAGRLGRKALAYFSYKHEKTTSEQMVAQKALQVLEKKTIFWAPWKTRLKIALNALFPRWITAQISKRLLSRRETQSAQRL